MVTTIDNVDFLRVESIGADEKETGIFQYRISIGDGPKVHRIYISGIEGRKMKVHFDVKSELEVQK